MNRCFINMHMKYYLEITTNIGCVNKCLYCPQSRLLSAYGSNTRMMSLTDFRTFLGTVPASTGILFSGLSEPWLNRNCTDMILHAHGKGHDVSVFTTMVGMKAVDIVRLGHVPFRSEFGNFTVHIPSMGNLEHISVTETYLSLMRLLLESRIDAQFVYLGLQPAPAVETLLRRYRKKPVKWTIQDRAGNLAQGEANRVWGRITCYRLTVNVLLPDGTVILCCQDYGLMHKIGNLKRDAYASLFSGSTYRHILHDLNDSAGNILCRTCSYAKRT